MKFIKGARTWRSILGTQTFFWPLTHPPTPPPRYSINQPLSKGLGGALMSITKGAYIVPLLSTGATFSQNKRHVPLLPRKWATVTSEPSFVPSGSQVTEDTLATQTAQQYYLCPLGFEHGTSRSRVICYAEPRDLGSHE